MSNFDLIRDAIENLHQVHAVYDGCPRQLCPHVLGYSKTGHPQALFYQFDGESNSGLNYDGSPKNWRCITLARLRDVRIVAGPWHSAPNHSRPQSCVYRIVVAVSYRT